MPNPNPAMENFTKIQPRDGETVMHCGHVDIKPRHFFGIEPEAEFTRPDGTRAKSRWMVLCQHCFNEHAAEPHKCIRADDIWDGDAPAIKNNLS